MDKRTKNSVRGYMNRKAGGEFEDAVEEACETYRRFGFADIEKTPEPMRIIQSLGGGRFIACFRKKAQPDFKGTLRGGRSVVFDAKHTTADRIEGKALLDWQRRALERHRRLGALAFVLVAFEGRGVYSIPIERWNGVQKEKRRKYIEPEDVPEWAVNINGGQLDFLDLLYKRRQT